MSVSGELLCSFELLKPLDSTALKNHIKKGRNKRNSMLSSPVSCPLLQYLSYFLRQGAAPRSLCNPAEKFVFSEATLSLGLLGSRLLMNDDLQPATVSAQSY